MLYNGGFSEDISAIPVIGYFSYYKKSMITRVLISSNVTNPISNAINNVNISRACGVNNNKTFQHVC